ncbi:hypothetical protein [Streptomyces heilongjiangensis]|uniref:Transglycosylase SLT domain-containing protein n=1 Tax=Streptomyces heilongjiangensis TaxID=945052 RepID=A0ABW1BEU1_9ACTN|nr:hypothetical protein [Streptomyces heilongjiangensis]MDC2950176.1 hypothetical protein [Streptomyces heilongjiangensis]
MCLLPLVMMVGLSGSRLTDGDDRRQQAFDSSKVPPAHVKWVIRAGSVCDVVTPSVVAAQIDTETGWLTGTSEDLQGSPPAPSPAASAPSESRALVGLSTSAFEEWGSDDDANGTATPLDPADAIMALGRFDCALAEGVQRLKESRLASGDALELTLAAYHSGLGSVERSRGVPEGEARDYVRRVRKLIPRYETGSGD